MGWFDDNHWAGSAYNFGMGYMCQGKYAGNRGYGAPRLPRARTTGNRRRSTTSTKAQKKAEKKRIKRQKERDNEEYIINSHIKRQKEKVGKHIYTGDYNKKVADAIIRLNDKLGSSLKSIKKVLHANANAKSRRFSSHRIVSALKSGTASGALINNGGRYKVATVGGKTGATKKPRNSKKREQDEGNGDAASQLKRARRRKARLPRLPLLRPQP
jgi:hypothetical protein